MTRKKRYRSAVTGKLVTKKHAGRNPKTTVAEKTKQRIMLGSGYPTLTLAEEVYLTTAGGNRVGLKNDRRISTDTIYNLILEET